VVFGTLHYDPCKLRTVVVIRQRFRFWNRRNL